MLNFWPFQSGGSKTGVACGIVGSEELKSAPLPRENDPRWKVGGKVAKINIYPVKSLTGISVHNAVVEKHGLRHGAIMDRQFMIIDQNGKFVTGRQYSRLVMVKVKIEGKSIILDGPGMDRITVAFPAAEFDNDEDSIVTTNVWGQECQGTDIGPEIGEWIGKFLDKESLNFRLIYHNYQQKSSTRQHQDDEDKLMPLTKADDVPLFADGFGFMLVNDASVAELNRKLSDKNANLKIDERRFRPNILVKGTDEAFCEDDWIYLKINGTIFRHTKYCTRCIFTTVDPDMGIKHPFGEPLKTLKSFRNSLDPREQEAYRNSPFFGINLGVENFGGTIQTGDTLYVITTNSLQKNNSNYSWTSIIIKWLPIALMLYYSGKKLQKHL